MRWLLALLLFFLTSVANAAEAPPELYFAPELAQRIYCPEEWLGPTPALSEFSNRHYSAQLRAAGEAALYQAAAPGKGVQIVRLTWARSFHPTVVVRVELPAAGVAKMTATRLSGSGGHEPGVVAERVDRTLSKAETQSLRARLADGGIARHPTVACNGPMLDGAQWIVERVDAAGYHLAMSQSPTDGAVHDLGLALLRLTGWTLTPVY